jgi:hypothetical protein
MRFLKDCEDWFDKPITIIQSPIKNVADAMCFYPSRGFGMFSPCTMILKQRVRKVWEKENKGCQLRYVWGMDFKEARRAEKLYDTMPKQEHLFPLIEKKLSKEQAHEILTASGIDRPKMYDLGYSNNNCVGCVKGGKGYWNKIRIDFPEIFAQRAALERHLGGSFRPDVYLDELDPEAGRNAPMIMGDCGILCEVIGI